MRKHILVFHNRPNSMLTKCIVYLPIHSTRLITRDIINHREYEDVKQVQKHQSTIQTQRGWKEKVGGNNKSQRNRALWQDRESNGEQTFKLLHIIAITFL